MALRPHNVDTQLNNLMRELAALRPALRGTVALAMDRWQGDAAALRFHLLQPFDPQKQPPITAILGGTGTGKSTLVNRLLGQNLSATNIRRTYTSGAVAFVADEKNLPAEWLGIEHIAVAAADLPARGRIDALMVATLRNELTEKLSLVDTPDLDGDTPSHHAQADRVFRWAQAVLFLVTPEKYQMTELLPYYRLALRYGLPALFAMNKVEEAAVLDDYVKQLHQREWNGAEPFAIPRDDAGYEPPSQANLPALRQALLHLRGSDAEGRQRGLCNRAIDLLGRLTDQITAPLRQNRREAEKLAESLTAMTTPEPGVDVAGVTRQLQRRMQQRSILYLIGPGRMIDRVRQVPGLILRLPRTLWDAVAKGEATLGVSDPAAGQDQKGVLPDFRATLIEQFSILQSRITDTLRSSPFAERWMVESAESYAAVRINPDIAGTIADEELASLKEWMEKRWNANPRDTDLLMKLLRVLPGGQKLAQWTEAAPYLLAVVVIVAHHPVVLGGYSLATWLTEKISNEVTARTRAANERIAERFLALAQAQIRRVNDWLLQIAPPAEILDRVEKIGDELAETIREAN